MKIKPKTAGQRIADTMITEVGKLEGGNVREIPPPHDAYTTGDCTLSIRNILNICHEDEQNQLAEMLNLLKKETNE